MVPFNVCMYVYVPSTGAIAIPKLTKINSENCKIIILQNLSTTQQWLYVQRVNVCMWHTFLTESIGFDDGHCLLCGEEVLHLLTGFLGVAGPVEWVDLHIFNRILRPQTLWCFLFGLLNFLRTEKLPPPLYGIFPS